VRATGSRAAAGFAGARSAALEAVALTQHHAAAVRPAEPIQSSVAAVTTGRLDRGERVEVEIDDGQQGVSSRRTLKRVGQRFELGGVDGLQRKQLGGGIVPTPRAAAAVGSPMRAGHRSWLLHLVAQTIASLALGIAQRCIAIGFAATGHGSSPLRNGIQGRPQAGTAAAAWRGGRPFDGSPGASRLFGGRCRAECPRC
jgi:hypothetical protein